MAKKPDVKKIVLAVLLRIALICATIYVAALSGSISFEILKDYLGYKTPDSFFGFTLADQFVALDLGLVFWSGIFFGAFGKWWDYILIAIFLSESTWDFKGTPTTTSAMLTGFVFAGILGNAIGFGLKLLRKKYFPKFDI